MRAVITPSFVTLLRAVGVPDNELVVVLEVGLTFKAALRSALAHLILPCVQ
ncbi:hypothetical protein GAJ32_22275 [Escherichia coli]|nr:hypothetical protein [Escherichia coli]